MAKAQAAYDAHVGEHSTDEQCVARAGRVDRTGPVVLDPVEAAAFQASQNALAVHDAAYTPSDHVVAMRAKADREMVFSEAFLSSDEEGPVVVMVYRDASTDANRRSNARGQSSLQV